MKNIASPITGGPVSVVDRVSTKNIVSLYGLNEGVDVKHYFEGVDQVLICSCKETGYRFYWPQSIIGDESFYKSLSSIEDYTRSWSFDHQFAFEKISENDTVLDIGCGSGDFLLQSKIHKTENVRGLELNPYMVEKCIEKGLNVSNESLSTHKVLNKGKYDIVCALQVLEHIYDVKSFIHDILYILKPGGRIILSTPNNEPYYMNYSKYETKNLPPHHIGLWNKESYMGLSDFFHLQIKDLMYCRPPSFKGNVYFKTNQLMNYKISWRNPLFYFTMAYAILFCGIRRIYKKYNGTYIAVELIRS
jgi:SAM-dependent methyltransferase